MKTTFLFLISTFYWFSIVTAQQDTMYIHNSGAITHKILISNIDSITFYTVQGAPSNVTGTFLDTRDNTTYKTVTIGDQTWMAENLNYGTMISASTDQTDNSISEKYCYDNLESNCISYGALYQWDELMQYSVIEESQGVCPSGWHVPSKSEWITLLDNYVSIEDASSELNAGGDSGFEALFGGAVSIPNNFFELGSYHAFWTSVVIDETYSWYVYYRSDTETFDPEADSYRDFGHSVRCIQD